MRRQAGFSLVELLITVLVLGILASIAVVSFRGPSRTAKAQALEVQIDAQANKLATWMNQVDADSKFGTGTAYGNPYASLNASVAKQFAPTADWVDSSPTNDKQLQASACTTVWQSAPTAINEPCAQITGCLDYFKSGRNLCLTYQYYPRGSSASPSLKTRRVTYCDTYCTVKIYSANVNGLATGSMSSPSTYTDNNPWAQVPDPGRN